MTDAQIHWCKKWPKRALLAACVGAAGVGLVTSVAEYKEQATHAVVGVQALVVPAQLAAQLGADASAWHRRRLLVLALGLFLVGEPALFYYAAVATADGAPGLAFGLTLSLMGAGAAWLAFLPPLATMRTAVAERQAAVALGALSGVGVLLLWLAGSGAFGHSGREGVWLSPVAMAGAAAFLTAAASDESDEAAWVAALAAGAAGNAGVWVLCGEPGAGAKLGGAVVALASLLQLRWVCARRLYGDNEPWSKQLGELTINFKARMGLLAALLALLGVSLASVGVSGGGYKWATAALFFAPLLLVLTRLSVGGRRAALVMAAAALALPAAQAAASAADVGGATAAAGRAFLVMGNWLAFASPGFVDLRAALAGVRDGAGEHSGGLRAAGVAALALAALLALCHAAAFRALGGPFLLAVTTLAFFLAAVHADAPAQLVWANLLWNGAALALMLLMASSDMPAVLMVAALLGAAGIGLFALFEVRTMDDPAGQFAPVSSSDGPLGLDAGVGEMALGGDPADSIEVDISLEETLNPTLPEEIPEC